MKKLIFLCIIFLGFSNGNPTYRIFNENGKPVRYQKMIRQISQADIILFGELHDNPISHWMELQITKDLYALKGENLLLGAEMFETDNQEALNKYVSGDSSDEEFYESIRLWKNYSTDYKPLVEFAKDHQLSFIATNIPHRYATMVYKKGFTALDTLSDTEKRWIAPLPIEYDSELPGYRSMKELGGMHMSIDEIENLPKAQAVKDATMAHFIQSNFENGKSFLHFNGAYHSNNFEGIVWYLRQAYPDLNIVTIYTTSAKQIKKLDPLLKGSNSFFVVVRDDMTKTF